MPATLLQNERNLLSHNNNHNVQIPPTLNNTVEPSSSTGLTLEDITDFLSDNANETSAYSDTNLSSLRNIISTCRDAGGFTDCVLDKDNVDEDNCDKDGVLSHLPETTTTTTSTSTFVTKFKNAVSKLLALCNDHNAYLRDLKLTLTPMLQTNSNTNTTLSEMNTNATTTKMRNERRCYWSERIKRDIRVLLLFNAQFTRRNFTNIDTHDGHDDDDDNEYSDNDKASASSIEFIKQRTEIEDLLTLFDNSINTSSTSNDSNDKSKDNLSQIEYVNKINSILSNLRATCVNNLVKLRSELEKFYLEDDDDIHTRTSTSANTNTSSYNSKVSDSLIKEQGIRQHYTHLHNESNRIRVASEDFGSYSQLYKVTNELSVRSQMLDFDSFRLERSIGGLNKVVNEYNNIADDGSSGKGNDNGNGEKRENLFKAWNNKISDNHTKNLKTQELMSSSNEYKEKLQGQISSLQTTASRLTQRINDIDTRHGDEMANNKSVLNGLHELGNGNEGVVDRVLLDVCLVGVLFDKREVRLKQLNREFGNNGRGKKMVRSKSWNQKMEMRRRKIKEVSEEDTRRNDIFNVIENAHKLDHDKYQNLATKLTLIKRSTQEIDVKLNALNTKQTKYNRKINSKTLQLNDKYTDITYYATEISRLRTLTLNLNNEINYLNSQFNDPKVKVVEGLEVDVKVLEEDVKDGLIEISEVEERIRVVEDKLAPWRSAKYL